MKKNLIILIIFAILGLAIYSNALDNPFLHDDDEVIVRNQGIRSIGNIPAIFVDPGLSAFDKYHAGHYRPFVTVSYAIDYAIWGLNSVGYHLINLVFHVGTAFLIFLIVKAMLDNSEQLAVSSKQKTESSEQLEVKSAYSSQLTANYLAPLAAGLIFLVHPFNSEAVNYATARSSVMSGFFYLLAFLCWVKFRSKKQEARREEAEARNEQTEARSKKLEARNKIGEGFSNFLPLTSCFYLCSLFAFIAGMLSKEIVITLPIMLWLYDLYFKDISHSALRTSHFLNWRSYITYIPFVAVIAAYMGIRHVLFAGMIPHFQRDLWTQFLTELPVLAGHWVLFLWPKNLTLIHHIEIYRSITWPVVLSFVFLILYIITAVYLWLKGRLRGRLISFIMLWFFVVLLPTSIVPLNRIFQENRGYLAIISFVVVAGVVLGEISRRFGSNNRIFKPVAAFLIVLLMVYSVVTVKRNIVWGDSLLFWQDAVAKSPQSGMAYAGLSSTYHAKGDLFLAIETARKGVAIDPGSYYLRVNLAKGYQLTGNMDKAIEEYENAIRIAPAEGLILSELSALYIEKGDMEYAETFIREALRKRGDVPHLYYQLGVILTARGEAEEASGLFRKAISLSPDNLLARYKLAGTLERMGRHSEAVQEYRDIVKTGDSVSNLSDISYGINLEVLKEAIEESRKKLDENRKQ